MTHIEALKLALEALKCAKVTTSTPGNFLFFEEAITAIKEALAQPQHEPSFSVQQAYAMAQVCLDLHEALGCKWGDNPYLAIAGLREAQPQQEPVRYEFQVPDGTWHPFLNKAHYENTVEDGGWPIRALYTSPPQRKPLATEQAQDIVEGESWGAEAIALNAQLLRTIRRTEAAHGIKE